MKMKYLEIVQDILNDLDSDEVNNIDDTVESLQVAQIVKSTYFAMMSNRNWPHLRKAIQTSNSNTIALPTHMYLDDDVKELCFINYDTRNLNETRRKYKPMTYLSPDAFLRKSNSYNSDADNVVVVQDPTGVELLIKTDKAPEYYTSFDDRAIIFDSYDSEVSNTLMGGHVQAVGYVMPTWEMDNDFIPDLPDEAFTALLESAKNRAFVKLKQYADVTASDEAGKQQRWLSRKAWKVEGGLQYPNYGRRR